MAFTAKQWQIFEQKFYRNVPYVICYLGHMTKMAAMPLYGNKPSKIFFSRNSVADCNEIWYGM